MTTDDTNGLTSILAPGAKVEKLAGGFKFIEGPIWFKEGYLLFSDIPANSIMKYTPDGKVSVFRTPCGSTNGHTLDLEGRLISCEHTGRRVSRTEKDGSVTLVADKIDGKRFSSPNDVVVKSDGSIWFTDPPYGLPNQTDGRETDCNGVYRLSKDGKLTLVARDFTRPNGLAFSPDESKLYIANSDTAENVLRVFDVKPDGTLTNGKLFADLQSPGKDGVADGLKVDTKGNLFTTGPEGEWVFNSSGKLLGKIIGPEVPANVAFGDADAKTLYITARTGLYSIRLQAPGIRPGTRN